MEKSKRLLEFDAMRGLAALFIVLFHYASSAKWQDSHPFHYFTYLEEFVQLFFILSGFFILLSFKRIKRSLDFIIGRFARLYPVYWISVISTIVITNITIFAKPRTDKIYDIVLNFSMFQEFFGAKNINIVYWTLTLELLFYIIILIIYKLKLIKYIDWICGFWMVLIIIDIFKVYSTSQSGAGLNASLMPIYSADNLVSNYSHLSFSTNAISVSNIVDYIKDFLKSKFLLLGGRAALFISGILLYQIKTFGFSKYRLGLIILCIFTKAIDYSPNTPRYSFLFFAFFTIIMYLAIHGKMQSFANKPCIFLGSISYALYLTHIQVKWLMDPLLAAIPNELGIIIKILVAILVASILTFKVEQPAFALIKSQYKHKFG